MASAEDIAAEMRRGYEKGTLAGRAAFTARLSDNVAGRHEPLGPDVEAWQAAFAAVVAHYPPPAPGVSARRMMEQYGAAEVAAFTKLMPDFRETATISVSGNDIIVDLSLTGTLDGKAIRLPFHSVYTVESGQIVRFVSTLDPATIRVWGNVLARAGGLAIPSE